MNPEARADLAQWITHAALEGRPDTEILDGFCERAKAAGLPLTRAIVFIDTLDPVHEGHAMRWTRDAQETARQGYGRTNEGERAAMWQRSPFFRLIETGETHSRHLITEGNDEFPILADLRAEGATEYLCAIHRFGEGGRIGEMDCVYSAWTTDRPDGFSDGEIDTLLGLLPHLAVAVKCAALGRIASTLVETYLGRDAGRMVLSGRIVRGVADRIDAVIWFSDLRGFTKITDTSPPEHIIPMLNDYGEAVISAVLESGGDVLKLIGDGVLAIFRGETRQAACMAAIAAHRAALTRIDALNMRRAADGLQTTHMYAGLHVGEVFFGNVGSTNRLDFTVVGPAVNEASRISAMCRSVDQSMLVSAAFAEALGSSGPALVSVGRYALRGVRAPQDLFTLEAESIAPRTRDY